MFVCLYLVDISYFVLVIHCGDPGTPLNGKQVNVQNKYNYGGSVEFACNANYTLAGKRKITCEETKDWSSSIPRCWGELYVMLTVIFNLGQTRSLILI